MKNLDADQLIATAIGILGASGILITLLRARSVQWILMESIFVASSLLYLGFRKRENLSYDLNTLHKGTLFLPSITVFIALFMMNILWLAFQSFETIFYLLTLGCIIVIILQILFLSQRNQTFSLAVLVEILCLAILLRLGPLLKYPGLLGDDSWFHASFASEITRVGYVPFHPLYMHFPVTHILTSIVMNLTCLDIKSSMVLSVGLPQLLTIIFIFLIAKKLKHENTGLLSALLLSINNDLTLWGTLSTPMSLGLSLTALLALLLFYSLFHSRSFKGLALFTVLPIVFTHTLTSIVALTICISVFFGQVLYRLLRSKIAINSRCSDRGSHSRHKVTVFFPTFVFLVIISYWLYVSFRFFKETVNSIQYMFSVYYITELPPRYVIEQPPIEFAFNEIGWFIVSILMFIGVFYLLSKKEQTLSRFTYLCILGSLFGVAYGDLIISTATYMPDRWQVFLAMFNSVAAAIGIVFIKSSLKEKRRQILIVILMSLLMFGSLLTTSVPYGRTTKYRPLVQSTQAEIEAAKTIVGHLGSQHKISSDLLSMQVYNFFGASIDERFPSIIISWNSAYIGKELGGDIIPIRKALFREGFIRVVFPREGFGIMGYNVELKSQIGELFENVNFNRLYDNDAVIAYLPTA